jgi:hypothetical protein
MLPIYNNNNNNDDNDDDKKNQDKKMTTLTWVFVVIWIVATLLAYWKAWSCTSAKLQGGDARKIANLIVVPLLGPFWWLLYYSESGRGYCM